MSNSPDSFAARLAAANFILNEIARDRITIDERGVLFVDQEQLDGEKRHLVGILTCIILDCVGGDTEPNITDKLSKDPSYHARTREVARRLRKGEIIDVLADFLALREQFA